MSVQSVLEIIAARLDNKPVEWHASGIWQTWLGTPRELVQALAAGHVFRVKRMPRTVWAIETASGAIIECDDSKEYIERRRQQTERLIEFREVLQ